LASSSTYLQDLQDVKLAQLQAEDKHSGSHQVLRHSFPCCTIRWDINSCVYGGTDPPRRVMNFEPGSIIMEAGSEAQGMPGV
jgi:hypothetical protein